MNTVFLSGDYIISPLGAGTSHNFQAIASGISAVSRQENPALHPRPFYAALIPEAETWNVSIKNAAQYTRLERLLIRCMQELISSCHIPLDEQTLLLLSTTKGNISLLYGHEAPLFPENRIFLPVMAAEISRFLGSANQLIPVSNACISGSLAIAVARQLMLAGRYQRAIVAGGDEVSRFILSGFDAFRALSDVPCRPFDRDRKGINLGEAVVAVYLTTEPTTGALQLTGSGACNDANHISGPSRTGEGLYRSIQAALREAGTDTADYISAHGTATLYNDDMEAMALQRSGLNGLPVNSLKGYYGHTLGASGLLETVLGAKALRAGMLIRSAGYDNPGTAAPLSVLQNNMPGSYSRFIKTASGFGGCNIATVFEKI